MKYLLKHEADPNAIDIATRSCLLHQACQRGCTDVVQLLIDYKADVNMRVRGLSSLLVQLSWGRCSLAQINGYGAYVQYL